MKNYINNVSTKLLLLAIVMVSTVIIIAACADKPSNYKPLAIGSPGELLVVIEDDVWLDESGRFLKTLLDDEYPALPQAELLFKKTRISYNEFERHFRTYRNVLLVSIRPKEKYSRVEYRRQEWARNQSCAVVIASSSEALKEVLSLKWPTIKGYFFNADIKAMAKSYVKEPQPEVLTHIQKLYPFSLYLPEGFQLKKTDGQFSWIDSHRMGGQLGIMVYRCSLDSLDEVNAHSLLSFRNDVLRRQVPGDVKGSFMSTEELFPVAVKKTKFAERQWTELRGLWKVQGDFMGGPFIDYFYEDKANNELLMLSGYVYAPAKPRKAIYMREIEAVLKTFEVN